MGKIISYKDLDVYNRAYNAAILVMKEVVSRLPSQEKYDLKDQLSRSCKAVPRLIAEGYAKKHQKFGFQKYLDDAMAESNETSVGLNQCIDLYFDFLDKALCEKLVGEYDIIGRQLFQLRKAWNKFSVSQKTKN